MFGYVLIVCCASLPRQSLPVLAELRALPGILVGLTDERAWVRWELPWTASAAGAATLAVRATDTAGNVQPQTVPWNKFGYLMNAIATRSATVQAG